MFCELRTHHYMEDEIFPQLAALEPTGRWPAADAEHVEVAAADLRHSVRGSRTRARPVESTVRPRRAERAPRRKRLGYEEEHIGPALARLAEHYTLSTTPEHYKATTSRTPMLITTAMAMHARSGQPFR